ncbi:hypothetical protein PV10_05802 [Exophiala mesophila]|uniref:NAD-dependent epimerase/dehydratase domain-containing protein n=1 Tax=Exophiala mesophila TaxID=212818 RepID=A0A0D1XSX5_EXOME|nr:uncharacterized protein PV10_05802 [Exophiala mesophila]KIV91241.1 hypothetical protein PV10_05802 [Exophiala mesophila]
MSPPLVLITGATGHVGLATLALLLKKGYRARIASRKLSSAESLKDLPSIRPYSLSISFVEIPDFLAPGAFDKAVQDVDYIIHVASPIPDPDTTGSRIDVRQQFIDPAVQGNLGILESAIKTDSVKRIIITSSVAILDAPADGRPAGPDDVGKVLDISQYEDTTNPWLAYRMSKRVAYLEADRFVREKNPKFQVIHVLPSFVQGRNESVRSAEELRQRVSSNTVMVNYVLGHQSDQPGPQDLVLVDDVAATHVAALEAKNLVTGDRLIAAYPLITKWDSVDDIVRKLFPQQVASGILPLGGKQPGAPSAGYDTSKTTEKLGIVFHGPEDMVKSLIGQYVELKEQETK